jgi:site-specific recombinase XerD
MSAKRDDGIPFMFTLKSGRYKYARRVPKHAQKAVGKIKWDISLGSNYAKAVEKVLSLTKVHDWELAQLKNPEDQASYVAAQGEEVEATELNFRSMGIAVTPIGHLEVDPDASFDANPGDWKNTSETMKAARALPREHEYQELAYFAAYAFGDHSALECIEQNRELNETSAITKCDGPHVNRIKYTSELSAAKADVMKPERPTDTVDSVMFDASKTALDARILEVGGAMLVNPDHTLHTMHARIAKLRNSKPETVANHKVTANRLQRFLVEKKGYDHEPSIASLTPKLLQEYRDHLLDDETIGNGSIHKYFDGMKSVFRYAMKEQRIPGLMSNPVQFIEMPRSAPVEDSMYLPFNREEIARVWEVAQEAWRLNNSKSQLSEGRRRAFLMCLRVLLWSGLRPIEFFWLRGHGAVTNDHIFITRTKTGVKRYIPICDHIASFPKFVQDGGFEDCIYTGNYRGEIQDKYNPAKLKEVMRDSFKAVRKRAKVTDKRKVLYSTKDTLLQYLSRGLRYWTRQEAGERAPLRWRAG